MSRPIPTLLLLALPASGKSELRRYLLSVPPGRAAEDLGLDRSVQLDDYPYVHLMRRISEELHRLDEHPTFFASGATPFIDPLDWGTLIHLVNEDYEALHLGVDPEPSSTAEWLLHRIDRARACVGLPPTLDHVSATGRAALASLIETDAAVLWSDRHDVIVQGHEEATVVIEFARGGPDGTTPPIDAPHGYAYALSQLSPEILDTASILYVWVTPEESRRRNDERARPGRDGDASILHHGVPETVMRQDYGIDDMMWLIETSDRPGTVRVEADETDHYLPVAVFDNRADKTSFLRADPHEWSAAAVADLHSELIQVFDGLSR
ncbi:MAG: hypothetical protein GY720_04810 [bacterium]|nr:hypothetical protein [bacterium]